jgi:hypothetical protein
MMRALIIVAAILIAGAAVAQTFSVTGQGPITPGHCAVWLNATTIGDSGIVCSAICTHKLDFSQPCNSQYIGVLQ